MLLGLSGRWLKYKNSPSEKSEKKCFEISASIVKNAEPNKTYFGTVKITTRHEAVGWPTIKVTVQRDTLTAEEGGYFGEAN